MVRFFEKLQAKEKAKPGSMSKLFSTHPPTGDRIKKVEEAITGVLPPKEEYVETTSEFDRVRTHLAKMENHYAAEDSTRPTLRRKSPAPDPDAGSDPSSPPDDPPELKRTPQSPLPSVEDENEFPNENRD
jgi:predicted Zn-dependent protease